MYRRFLWVGFGWYTLSAFVLSFGVEFGRPLGWLSGLTALTLLNLLALTELVAAVFAWVAAPESERTSRLKFRMMGWLFTKLVFLGTFVFVIYGATNAPKAALILGTSTWMIVPFVGGLWWNRKEFGHA
jgi:hypothetical protein